MNDHLLEIFKESLSSEQKKKFNELEVLSNEERIKEIHNHQCSRAIYFHQEFSKNYNDKLIQEDINALVIYIYEKAYEDGRKYGVYEMLGE